MHRHQSPVDMPKSFQNEMHPDLRKKYTEPRGVFTPHTRMRFNIVPLFINATVPWILFVLVFGLTALEPMYYAAAWVYLAVFVVFLIFVASVAMAAWAKRGEADPTWYAYFALAVGIALFAGLYCGRNLYEAYTLPAIELESLRTVKDFDVSRTPGQNVLDAGTFYFTAGTYPDGETSWHFKRAPGGDVFCVAPLLSAGTSYPETQSYDFWAVGKDCCSETAADYRCGEPANEDKPAALRITNTDDITFYRLAVQQATSLHSIKAVSPIFIEWHKDPEDEIDDWKDEAGEHVAFGSLLAFVYFLFLLAMFSVKFACLGRSYPKPYAMSGHGGHGGYGAFHI